MRKLSEQELEMIHTRLKSLHIRYTEVYAEIFDHYYSALEKCSENISEEVLQKLNCDFSEEAVRKMEKSLDTSSHKLLVQLQWNELKFWRNDIQSVAYQILLLSVLALMFYYFDIPGMYLSIGVFSIVAVPILWFSIYKDSIFSIRKLTISSSNAFINQIISRGVKYYFGLAYFVLAVITWNDGYVLIEATILGAINIFSFIYMLTLLQVALKWKQKQPLSANQ